MMQSKAATAWGKYIKHMTIYIYIYKGLSMPKRFNKLGIHTNGDIQIRITGEFLGDFNRVGSMMMF